MAEQGLIDSTPGGVHAESYGRAGEPGSCCWAGNDGRAGERGRGAAHGGSSGSRSGQVSDELPNPAEEKRRELREAALTEGAQGRGQGPEPQRQQGRQGRRDPDHDGVGHGGRGGSVRRAPAREDGQDLRRARGVRQRAPSGLSRTRTRTRTRRARRRSNGPLHNAIPAPDRTKDNSTVWQPDYNRQHFQDLYFGTGEDSLKSYYEKQSSRALQRRRHGHRLGQGPLQRGPLRALERLPVRGQRLLEHVEPDPGRDQRVGRSAARRRPHRRADQGRPRVL